MVNKETMATCGLVVLMVGTFSVFIGIGLAMERDLALGEISTEETVREKHMREGGVYSVPLCISSPLSGCMILAGLPLMAIGIGMTLTAVTLRGREKAKILKKLEDVEV